MDTKGDALPSLNEMIDPNKDDISISKVNTVQTSQPVMQTSQYSYSRTTKESPSKNQESTYKRNITTTTTTRINEEPESTTTITRNVIQSGQPTTGTSSYVSKKVITTTTTTRGGGNPSTQTNVTRYSNTNTNSYKVNRNQTSTTNSNTRPGGIQTTKTTTTTSQYNRYGQNNPNTNSQVYRGNQRNAQSTPKISSSQSYSGNKYQLKRPETSYSNNRARSPEPGSFQKKTINRGKPVENIQITHIIFTSSPAEFHLKENLDLENLNKQPIQISKADRMKLQKSGKVSSTCSCDKVNISPPKKINLKGTTTVYQHARGIGMTNEKGNVNPYFYSSEIKTMQPISKNKEQEKLENIEEFRSKGKVYYNSPSPSKTNVKNSAYNRGGMNNNSAQKRTYNSGIKNNYNRGGGMGSSTKTTTTTTTNKVYRGGNNMDGGDGEIIKETKTKVQMGSRSQYNQTKPTTYTTTEKKVISQKNFFNK